MKKFILNISGFYLYPCNPEKFAELISLERHFTTLDMVVHENVVESQVMDLIERHGQRLIDLKLIYAGWTPQAMQKILKHVSELETLSLSLLNCRPDSQQADNTGDPVTMRKLKKLSVTGHFDIFQLIQTPILVELKALGTETDSNRRSFENFLNSSMKLESLEISPGVFDRIRPRFPFRLKSIILPMRSSALNERIEEFLLSQAATVETLEVECDDSKFHEFVLKTFKQLRTLKSNLHMLAATSQYFYKDLKPLPLLTEIRSYRGFSFDTATRAVLKNCPNLLKLKCSLDRTLPDHLEFIADHNKSLKELSVRTIKETNARLHNLKYLTLHEVGNADHLIAFIKSNPTIKNLRIQNLSPDGLDSEKFCTLITETRLKHVEVVEVCHATKHAIYHKVKNRFKNSEKIDCIINFYETLKVYITRKKTKKGAKRKLK